MDRKVSSPVIINYIRRGEKSILYRGLQHVGHLKPSTYSISYSILFLKHYPLWIQVAI